MKKYIIVKANHLDTLENFVNEAINNGYTPIGGPFCIGSGECHEIWFAQAMVLR